MNLLEINSKYFEFRCSPQELWIFVNAISGVCDGSLPDKSFLKVRGTLEECDRISNNLLCWLKDDNRKKLTFEGNNMELLNYSREWVDFRLSRHELEIIKDALETAYQEFEYGEFSTLIGADPEEGKSILELLDQCLAKNCE